MPTNLNGLRQAIDNLQQSGGIIGIHSDSPLPTIKQFGKMFGISGPYIYEMAAIHFPDTQIDISLDTSAYQFFSTFRENFYRVAKNFFSKSVISNIILFSKNKSDLVDGKINKSMPYIDIAML